MRTARVCTRTHAVCMPLHVPKCGCQMCIILQIRWLGMLNLVAAPFVFCYLMIVTLFAHGAELKYVL